MVGSKKLSQGLNVRVRRGNIMQQGWGWMLNTRWLVQRSVVKASNLVRVRVRLYRHRISMRSGSLILIHVRVVVVIRICSDHSYSCWGYCCYQNVLLTILIHGGVTVVIRMHSDNLSLWL